MIDKVISLCKRRGFIFQSSELYGGLQGVYDYGPLGVELKNNLKASWWKSMVYQRDDIEGMDTAILSNKLTMKYSGHEDTFSDLMQDCYDCKHRMKVIEKQSECNNCSSKNLTEPRNFNLMFKTNFGPIDNNYAYLRPETAQGIFINFKNIMDSTHRKIPFGIAQIGKSFRNEITPGNFIFRTREFEQMELEYFVEPASDDKWHSYWTYERLNWWVNQGLQLGNIKLYEQPKKELAHYAKSTIDILYNFPFGFQEIEGIANRGDFDLSSHSKSENNVDSVNNLNVNGVIPYVIESSAGVDRGILALLLDAYTEEKLDNGSERIILKIKPHLSPIKVAIIPLAKNNEIIVSFSKYIYANLLKLGIGKIKYEDCGVGKAYRRHDEIGTPICITVDFESLEGEKSVTVRDRDSMKQERVSVESLELFIQNKLKQ